MNEAIAESRRHETAWPREHYLWRLHPVVGWLNDRMLAAFGRHEAPVLSGVPGLARDEAVFVIDSLVPFDDLLERTGLGGAKLIPNRGLSVDVDALARRLPAAVEQTRKFIVERRGRFEKVINAKLDEELRALEELKARRLTQLELKLEQSSQPAAQKTNRKKRARDDIDDVFNDYWQWIEDTMTTEETPWLKVICVMVGSS